MEKSDNSLYKMRWWILSIVILQPFMSCLDGSIVNVALPVMSRKLHVPEASIQLVITSYLIVITSIILIFGRISDIISKTAMFKIGLFLFTIGSLMCGMSTSLNFLIFSRIIQGIGAAAAMASNQGIITQVFPPNERGRALGINGSFVALGTLLGPPLGGFIVSKLSWNYIFLINVPIGIIATIFGLRILPKTNKIIKESFDFKGTLFFMISSIALFESINSIEESGIENPYIIAGLILSVIAIIIFIKIEKKSDMPLLDLKLFDNKLFTVSVICSFISFLVLNSSNIIIPFYLQDAMKFSPGKTGLIMMASPVVLSFIAPISGYLSDRIGSEFLTFVGLIITSVGLLLMSFLTQYSPISLIIAFIALMSLGNGMFQSPNTSLIMSLVPKNKLGIAGSINGLVRNMGFVFGISLSTIALYGFMSQKAGYHVNNFIEGKTYIFIYAMRYVYILSAVMCLIGAGITALRLYNKKKVTD